MPVNRKLKFFLNYILGPVIFLWVSYTIYQRISHQPHLAEAWASIVRSVTGRRSWCLAAAVALMSVNWGIEARKWQLLLRQIEKVSFAKAFYSVLTGVSISVNTPNRVGEYGGRILYLRPENRLKAISLNMVTSVSQLIVTVVMGMIGVLYLDSHFPTRLLDAHGLTGVLIRVLLYGGLGFSILTILLYFRLSWLVRLLETIPALKRVRPYIEVLDHYEWPILVSMLTLSLVRFVVFVTQYLLLFRLLQVDVQWWQGFWAVSVLFLILAVIPTIAISELMVRVEGAVALIGLYSGNVLGIWAASFAIWIVNLVIPALLGSFLILGIKIVREK